MAPKTELPPSYKFAEDIEEGDVVNIASNHYVVTTKTLNAFKEITLWMELHVTHALYTSPPQQRKATLTLDPKTIIHIYE